MSAFVYRQAISEAVYGAENVMIDDRLIGQLAIQIVLITGGEPIACRASTIWFTCDEWEPSRAGVPREPE